MAHAAVVPVSALVAALFACTGSSSPEGPGGTAGSGGAGAAGASAGYGGTGGGTAGSGETGGADGPGGAGAQSGNGGAQGGIAGRSGAGGVPVAGRGGSVTAGGSPRGGGRDGGEGGSTDAGAGGAIELALPPVNAGLDYQLGGAYSPPAGVSVVSRDRNAATAPGLYNVCYVNGFQIQPGEEEFWLDEHADLVLRDDGGDPIVDPDWGEMLIDVSTDAKRQAVASIVGEWIRGCALSGFDAVEIDNLDSFSRSGGRLAESHNIAMMRRFADAAHAVGLAAAQKNSAELATRRAELGTDFAVAEECNRWSECDAYTDVYGEHVLVIEYRQVDFEAGCAAYPDLSIVLRDVNLVPPSSSAYVFDGC